MDLFKTAGCHVMQMIISIRKNTRSIRKLTIEDGDGALYSAARLLRSNRLHKPLLVIRRDDMSLAESLCRSLVENDISYETWDEIPQLPVAQTGEDISLFFLRSECDCLLALGDSGLIDIVKLAAVRAASPRKTVAAMAGKNNLQAHRVPPVFAIPTAAGFCAESLAEAAFYEQDGTRLCAAGSALMTAFAVLDPALLSHTPRSLVASGGMIGLCRAVEAYICPIYGDSASRNQAARAVKAFLGALEPCWNDGGTDDQRSELLRASVLAGQAASRAGYGYVWALSCAADTVFGCGIGEAIAVLLPAVLEKYGANAQERLAALAMTAQIKSTGSREEKAAALIDRLRKTAFCIGLADNFDGLSEEMAAQIAVFAEADANPRCSCPVVFGKTELTAVMTGVRGIHN